MAGKVVFFNRFFHPDPSATSQMLSDLAFALADEAIEVHVVTGRLPAPGETPNIMNGVRVHAITGAISPSKNLLARAVSYLRYYLGARRAARDWLDPGDVAVAKTDPPMLATFIETAVRARGAKLVAWMQDVFPEVAAEYGIPGMRGWIGKALARARDRTLARADAVVAIGDRMAETLRERLGTPVDVIHNWADGHAIEPLDATDNPLREEWGLAGKFVVGYSGNLGRVHEFATLLDAAERLRGHPDVVFVIVGRGPRLAAVKAAAERRSLRNVRFEPLQARERLRTSLSLPDVHVCVLRRRFEGLVHPSKLYGIMAAGRPTLVVGDPDGEAARIVASTASGLFVREGDAEALASAILRLRDSPGVGNEMGINARAAFVRDYDLGHAMAAWRALLSRLGISSAKTQCERPSGPSGPSIASA